MKHGRAKMLPISPGTAEWDAWFKHYAGSKMQVRMLSCLADQRPFYVWSRFPPLAPARADNLAAERVRARPAQVLLTKDGPSRSLDYVAARLEAKAVRDSGQTAVDREQKKTRAKQARALDRAFAAVNEDRAPPLDGCGEIGVVRVVDPYDEEQVRKGKRASAVPRPKLTSLRGDPVGLMHRRGQLGDDADADIRLRAARHLQGLYEAAEIGGARGIDPSRPLVQSGTLAEPDTDRRMQAARLIERVEAAAAERQGSDGAELVRVVLWHKLTFAQAAAKDGGGRRAAEYLAELFRRCLDVVAGELGYRVASGSRHRRPRDAFDVLAPHADNPALYAAVHRAKRSV